MENNPYVITISRELGSGGAYFGKKLSKRLGILYVDREILKGAAKQLNISDQDLECRDEKVTSFWQSLVMSYANGVPDIYIPPQIYIPTDGEFYKAETEIIQSTANNTSCVIVGHAGSFVLRKHPKHLSIFLHADKEFRKKRVMELYKVPENKAKKLIAESDKDRVHYYNVLSGENWLEALQYDICIDTSKMDFDKIEDLLVECVKTRFEDAKDNK